MPRPVRPLLLTGFEAFDGAAGNPSAVLLEALRGERFGPAATPVETLLLPVSFRTAVAVLRRRLKDPDRALPRAVVALGLAGNRAQISLERVAINLIDARIPDNAGHQPIDVPVRRGGPAAHFATLPLKRMLAAALAQELPVALSLSAGSFVCNALFYHLLDALTGTRVPAGFIHVPWLPGQAPVAAGSAVTPALPLAVQLCALRVLLHAALAAPTRGPRFSAGSEC